MKLDARSHFQSAVEFLLWVCGLSFGLILVVGAIDARASREESESIGITVHSAKNLGQTSWLTKPKDSPVLKAAVSRNDRGEDQRGSADSVIGRLEIQQIGLAVPVMSDFDSSSLLKGVGQIKGTAMPGGLGTLGLAGHRDTYFRALKNIANDMEIRVIDKTGIYHYIVDSTEIVTPDQVQVLDIKDRPELTLITCYPFDYVGAAPKRFIVHAHLMSATPDA